MQVMGPDWELEMVEVRGHLVAIHTEDILLLNHRANLIFHVREMKNYFRIFVSSHRNSCCRIESYFCVDICSR